MSSAHARTFPAVHVFLKMQEPRVMAPDEPEPPPTKTLEWMKYWLFRTSDLRFIPDPRLIEYVAEYKRCQRKETIPWKNSQIFMNILFPTKYWTENGIRYKQMVSIEQVTRDDLKAMNERLDQQLIYRQSQATTGYCPVRFQLHMELFDEIIREVSLNSPSRAYMLEMVRGELNQTLDSYRKVLDVSLDESKLVVSDKVDPEFLFLQNKMDDAQAEFTEAETEYLNAISDYEVLVNKYELYESIKAQVEGPEIDFLKRLNEALVRQLYHFDNPHNFDDEEESSEMDVTFKY